MKFKIHNDWNGLSLRIIALFATAMLISYSPDYLRTFFADSLYPADQGHYGRGFIDCDWSWGYRHHLYFFMCLALFFVQTARLFKWCDDSNRDFKP